ncbi:nuclear transport factor 2 family protein [Catenovulum sp. SM1970]|uniref:nuclear transport factor 2 family protein n=1 Tax=Marinifaba aquimaris TaxID=2741323 RepID=UPI0015746DC6|nr:nuclear transport factor 2 family protein [Marinifaba aquimaris]NTS76436.1 nuclear transport factor 2 family protein [Marinifaba aquimaris]
MSKKRFIPLFLFIFPFLSACQLTSEPTSQTKQNQFNQKQIKQVVQEYVLAYSLRDDFNHFMRFYAQDAVVEDIINGDKKVGKKAISAFFNWPDKKFSLDKSQVTLVVENIAVDGPNAVLKGYFMPFRYDGLKLGPWHFTTWLTFDENLLIVKQVDFINYAPKALFQNNKDANKWIKPPQHLIKNY